MKKESLSYLITVSQAHILPALNLIRTLKYKTKNDIIVVGNINQDEEYKFTQEGISYINENEIDFDNRLPNVQWIEKYREFGWYKQMFIRLCIDKFMKTDQVVLLDSKVFVFDNWDEQRFYDPSTHQPRCFYWIPETRKPEWDYKKYRGAAYLLSFLPECRHIMDYAHSDTFKRYTSGVVLFSTKNVKFLWNKLENETDLEKNRDTLFNHESDLAFSDADFYGLAVECHLFNEAVPTVMCNDLQGWHDEHNAMWSMCQKQDEYNSPRKYYDFMKKNAHSLNKQLPPIPYWNKKDEDLIIALPDTQEMSYFKKYKKQLNHTKRMRYESMMTALELLHAMEKSDPVFIEIGTLRDKTRGGGHSTIKFAEYCTKFGGHLHTVDIDQNAIVHAIKVTHDFYPWIDYSVNDSVEYLRNFENTIDFLYLDGLDSTEGNEELASRKQLDEIKAAMPKLSEKCVVLLDDADLPYGGKTRYSSQFLEANGFYLYVNHYQKVYAKGLKPPHYLKQKMSRVMYHIKALPRGI